MVAEGKLLLTWDNLQFSVVGCVPLQLVSQ